MLTSKPFLASAVARIRNRSPQYAEHFRKELRKADLLALSLAPTVLDQVENAKATLRDEELFYDPTSYKNARWILEGAYKLVEAAYFPTKIDFLTYDIGSIYNVSNILGHLVDAQSNVFLDYFRTEVVSRIERIDPLVIGLSINFGSQLLPSLTLCRLLRELLPHVPTVFEVWLSFLIFTPIRWIS